jgi:hypothetical protein
VNPALQKVDRTDADIQQFAFSKSESIAALDKSAQPWCLGVCGECRVPRVFYKSLARLPFLQATWEFRDAIDERRGHELVNYAARDYPWAWDAFHNLTAAKPSG